MKNFNRKKNIQQTDIILEKVYSHFQLIIHMAKKKRNKSYVIQQHLNNNGHLKLQTHFKNLMCDNNMAKLSSVI